MGFPEINLEYKGILSDIVLRRRILLILKGAEVVAYLRGLAVNYTKLVIRRQYYYFRKVSDEISRYFFIILFFKLSWFRRSNFFLLWYIE